MVNHWHSAHACMRASNQYHCDIAGAGWWIRDLNFRQGQYNTSLGAPSDGWDGGIVIGGMQIACEDACHKYDAVQLPYMYGCSSNLAFEENIGYNTIPGVFPDGMTSFQVT